MRLAIISDIHGNLHALEEVLRDIEAQRVDQVVVNGDFVNRGPHNAAVMKRLVGQGYILTLGNHDDLMLKWVAHDPDIPEAWYGDPFWKGTAWSVNQLVAEGWLDALRQLPMTYRVEMPGAPSLLVSHGSPRHYREGYGSFLPDEKLSEIVHSYPADLLVGSHTHRPYERTFGRHTILNTGAVGAPFNSDPRAQYLLLTLRGARWQWEFRTVPYDRAAALAAYEELGYVPEGDLSALIFREELRHAIPLHSAFWVWAEQQQRRMDWPAWYDFWESFKEHIPPLTA